MQLKHQPGLHSHAFSPSTGVVPLYCCLNTFHTHIKHAIHYHRCSVRSYRKRSSRQRLASAVVLGRPINTVKEDAAVTPNDTSSNNTTYRTGTRDFSLYTMLPSRIARQPLGPWDGLYGECLCHSYSGKGWSRG